MNYNGQHFVLNSAEKLVLGIRHDQPFTPSQMPVIHSLAKDAIQGAAAVDVSAFNAKLSAGQAVEHVFEYFQTNGSRSGALFDIMAFFPTSTDRS